MSADTTSISSEIVQKGQRTVKFPIDRLEGTYGQCKLSVPVLINMVGAEVNVHPF